MSVLLTDRAHLFAQCDAIADEFDLEYDSAAQNWVARLAGTRVFSYTKPKVSSECQKQG